MDSFPRFGDKEATGHLARGRGAREGTEEGAGGAGGGHEKVGGAEVAAASGPVGGVREEGLQVRHFCLNCCFNNLHTQTFFWRSKNRFARVFTLACPATCHSKKRN